MFAEIILNTQKGQHTVFYESGVQYVCCDYEKSITYVKLQQDYTTRQFVKEYNISTTPFMYAYDCAVRIHIAEK